MIRAGLRAAANAAVRLHRNRKKSILSTVTKWITNVNDPDFSLDRTEARMSTVRTAPIQVENLVDTDLTNWAESETGTAVVSATQNQLVATHNASADRAYLSANMSVTNGQTYTLSVDITLDEIGSGTFLAKVGAGGTFIKNSTGEVGTLSLTFTATASGTAEVRIGPGSGGAPGIGTVSMRNVRIVEGPVASDPFPPGSPAGTVQDFTINGVVQVEPVVLPINLVAERRTAAPSSYITSAGSFSGDVFSSTGVGTIYARSSTATDAGQHTAEFTLRVLTGQLSGALIGIEEVGASGLTTTAIPTTNIGESVTVVHSANFDGGGSDSRVWLRFVPDGCSLELTAVSLIQGSTPSQPFPAGSPAGTPLADHKQQGLVHFLMVAGGATNLVDTDLTNWTETVSAGSPVFEVTSNSAQITHNNTSDRGYLLFNANVTSGLTYTLTVQLAETSIASAVYLAKLGAGGNFVGGSETEAGTISLTFTATATGAADIRVGPGAASTTDAGSATIENVRLVQGDSAYPGTPPGSAAGSSFDADLAEIDLAAYPVGSIASCGISYGYDGGLNPNNPGGRFYDGEMIQVGAVSTSAGADPRAYDGSFAGPLTAGGVALADGVPQVYMHTWDGVTRTFRGGSASPSSVASASTLSSGVMYIGNNSGGSRPFHGVLAIALFDRVLTDDEYAEVRTALLAEANKLVLH